MADETISMQGKVVLVTGATQGIGLAAAQALGRLGAKLVLVGRNPQRCQAAADRVRAAAPGTEVETLLADLSRRADVNRLADQVLSRLDRLDVLVNNAGGFFLRREVTAEGHEMTFALNHLAYFLLTVRLLDLLKQTAAEQGQARVVSVASEAQRGGRLNFEDLQSERGYAGFRAYSQSKQANILFTQELARRLAGTGVTANAMHPGFIASGFAKNNGWLVGLGMKLLAPFSKKPEEGAETVVYLASSPEVSGLSGMYFIDCRPVHPGQAASDPEGARRLWEVSEKLAGLPDRQS
jgi:NAD(P)-dependent dehydrogenase (short-subunit alcohol dehydrogenase family)